MGKSTNTFYWVIAQRGTRPQKSLLFVWPLVYNRAKLQWLTKRRKLYFFSIDDMLRSTVINAIYTRNMSGLNVECGMLVGYNSVSDWRSSAKTATFFGLERKNSTTVKTM